MTNKSAKNTPTVKKKDDKAMAKMLAEQERKKQHNERALLHLTHIQKLDCADISNVETVENTLVEYFNICHADGQPPTASGLALSLGVSREELIKWVNGQNKMPNREVVAKYFALLETYDEIAMKSGEIPPLNAIFLAKNNYGYKDRVEIGRVEEEMTDEEIERRYRAKHEIVSDQ